jgi:ubiquitin carboxyl-terminal hydrolase L3
MSADRYRKHYFPLESNPEIFTKLLHALGGSTALSFNDILSLEDQSLDGALALILLFPTSQAYQARVEKEDALRSNYTESSEEDIIWFKQTINNACGLYAILHAICNGAARYFIGTKFLLPKRVALSYIESDSLLERLLATCLPLKAADRALALEASQELEAIYTTAALQGDSARPKNAEDDVDFHYVCFVKSTERGHIYELDGDRKGPIDKGACPTRESALPRGYRRILEEFIEQNGSGNLNFSLIALAKE